MVKKNKKNKFNGELSQRQLRVSELIRRVCSSVLLDSNFYDEYGNNYSASVSEVRCSPDLKIATVYVLPISNIEPENLIMFLDKKKGEIRHSLSKKLNLKFSPELRFKPDKLIEQIEQTNKIFEGIDNKN
jgi:ribosome-binding factor A